MNIALCDKKNGRLKIFTSSGVLEYNKKNPTVSSFGDDVVLIDRVSGVSGTQLAEWLKLSSWFDGFEKMMIAEAFHLPVIFYDTSKNLVKLCTNDIKTYKIGDDKLASSLPKGRLAYVESAHIMSSKQFEAWLKDEYKVPANLTEQTQKIPLLRQYLHCTSNGTVIIGDISLDGIGPLIITGKYHFIPVDTIGEERMKSSSHFKILLQKGKVEIVDEDYVMLNKNKSNKALKSSKTSLPIGSVKDFDTDSDSNTITINI